MEKFDPDSWAYHARKVMDDFRPSDLEYRLAEKVLFLTEEVRMLRSSARESLNRAQLECDFHESANFEPVRGGGINEQESRANHF